MESPADSVDAVAPQQKTKTLTEKVSEAMNKVQEIIHYEKKQE